MHDVPTLERAVLGLKDSQVHEPPDVRRARAGPIGELLFGEAVGHPTASQSA